MGAVSKIILIGLSAFENNSNRLSGFENNSKGNSATPSIAMPPHHHHFLKRCHFQTPTS